MVDKINEEIRPTVDAKTAELGPMAQMALRKAVKKMVEKLVDEAVKAFLSSNKKNRNQQ